MPAGGMICKRKLNSIPGYQLAVILAFAGEICTHRVGRYTVQHGTGINRSNAELPIVSAMTQESLFSPGQIGGPPGIQALRQSAQLVAGNWPRTPPYEVAR